MQYETIQVTYKEQTLEFYIYNDGSVYDQEDMLICESEGIVCLEAYLNKMKEADKYTEITLTLNGVTSVYIVRGNGQVTDNKGTIICETGGEQCLPDWIKANTKVFKVATFTIDGAEYVFKVYEDGSVTDSQEI